MSGNELSEALARLVDEQGPQRAERLRVRNAASCVTVLRTNGLGAFADDASEARGRPRRPSRKMRDSGIRATFASLERMRRSSGSRLLSWSSSAPRDLPIVTTVPCSRIVIVCQHRSINWFRLDKLRENFTGSSAFSEQFDLNLDLELDLQSNQVYNSRLSSMEVERARLSEHETSCRPIIGERHSRAGQRSGAMRVSWDCRWQDENRRTTTAAARCLGRCVATGALRKWGREYRMYCRVMSSYGCSGKPIASRRAFRSPSAESRYTTIMCHPSIRLFSGTEFGGLRVWQPIFSFLLWLQ